MRLYTPHEAMKRNDNIVNIVGLGILTAAVVAYMIDIATAPRQIRSRNEFY